MRIVFPKDTERIQWTRHVKNKMLYYGLSEQRIRRVFTSPDRKEVGIAPHTHAAMQRSRTKKKPEEIWVMYQEMTNNKQPITNNKKSHKSKVIRYTSGAKLLMISAWRYPGITKPGEPIPIPDDIAEGFAE